MSPRFRSRYQARSCRRLSLCLCLLRLPLLCILMFWLLAASEWIIWQNRNRCIIKIKDTYLSFTIPPKISLGYKSSPFSEKGYRSSRNFFRENSFSIQIGYTSHQDLLLTHFLYLLSCWITLKCLCRVLCLKFPFLAQLLFFLVFFLMASFLCWEWYALNKIWSTRRCMISYWIQHSTVLIYIYIYIYIYPFADANPATAWSLCCEY